MKIYNELKRLAERLNNGEKINWRNDCHSKNYIEYNHCNKRFETASNQTYQKQGVIYCLDHKFKDIAIQEIGEDRLKKLFE